MTAKERDTRPNDPEIHEALRLPQFDLGQEPVELPDESTLYEAEVDQFNQEEQNFQLRAKQLELQIKETEAAKAQAEATKAQAEAAKAQAEVERLSLGNHLIPKVYRSIISFTGILLLGALGMTAMVGAGLWAIPASVLIAMYSTSGLGILVTFMKVLFGK